MLKFLEKNYLPLFVVSFIGLLFIGYEKGLVANKYLSEWGIENLFKNYYWFPEKFYDFISYTIPLAEGNTACAWKSFYYLLPLFSFLKLIGGLSLHHLYLFNFTAFLFSLIVFYKLSERYFGRQTANIGALFLAFSSWFFEFALSYTFYGLTVLTALILIYLMFGCLERAGPISYFFLGLLTGLSLYYYGPVRFLLPVVLVVLLTKKEHWRKKIIYFLGGLAPILLLSIFLNDGYIVRFFDREDIFYVGLHQEYSRPLILRWYDNLRFFLKVLSGRYFSLADIHAGLLNRILVLPLIVGIIYAFKNRKTNRYRLLLFMAGAIMLLPVFTTSFHTQPRRFILYMLPIYLLIGLGGAWIVNFISSIKRKKVKIFLTCFVICISAYALSGELFYSKANICSGRRDIGFMDLSRKIKEFSLKGPLIYFQETPHQLFEVDCENFLLMLALGAIKTDYEIALISDLAAVDIKDKVYLIKSPFISRDLFNEMADERRWSYEELFSSPFNGRFKDTDNFFRVYALEKSGK